MQGILTDAPSDNRCKPQLLLFFSHLYNVFGMMFTVSRYSSQWQPSSAPGRCALSYHLATTTVMWSELPSHACHRSPHMRYSCCLPFAVQCPVSMSQLAHRGRLTWQCSSSCGSGCASSCQRPPVDEDTEWVDIASSSFESFITYQCFAPPACTCAQKTSRTGHLRYWR